jgi:hypothetical protein
VSLGGYYAPRVAAAAGDRVKGCVALAGPYNFGDCWDRLPELTRTAFRVRTARATTTRPGARQPRWTSPGMPEDLVPAARGLRQA